ncbi:MAG: flagellar hook-basal body complex protein [Alphaproteobacteria bacterium]|nr:flagellar hook-basal body complex protein [Alphaproteobacteria bacterium]
MSIFGAMQSGISGLAAQSTAMGAISDNISNVNTVGYKNNSVAFSTLVTKQVSSNHYAPGGVQPVSKQSVNAQGLLAANSSSTAIAVSGNGYFVVNSAAHPGESDVWAYTRAGDFDIDERGYLVNTGGFYLQGWSLLPWDGNSNATVVNYNGINYMKAYYDAQGNTVYINDNIVDSRNLRPINLSTIGGSATPTQQISYGANLPSGDPIFSTANPTAGGRHSVNALIYDSLGNASNMNLTYTKQSSNTWGMAASLPKGAASITLTGTKENAKDPSPDVYFAAGQMEFTSIPDSGSVISITDEQTGQTFNFEFTKTPNNVVDGNIAIDISTGIVSTNDLTNRFVEVIQSVMPGAGRFSADANRVYIEQSVGGGALAINTSKTLACVQSAANPDETGVPTGTFRVEAIDDEIKNTATISFTSSDPAAYKDKTFAVGGQVYEFVEGTVPSDPAYVAINLNEAMVDIDGNGVMDIDAVEIASRVAAAIKNKIAEPERVTSSGTSVQFIPTSTGPDLSLDFAGVKGTTGLAGIAKGEGRNGTSPDFVDLTKTPVILSNSFKLNNTEVEAGSIVPAVKFNSDGTPQYFFVNSMSIEWANGAQNMNGDYGEGTPISLQMGNIGTNDGLTSLAGNFNTNYITQDGAKFGSYAGVSIDESGVVTALYDNGETRPIAILPLATFSNPNGMGALTGNAWIETDYSGQALLKMANTNGAGKVEANSLEQSTVDLATEFSNMIITQRAYSAATKIITTADEMLDELTRMT